MTDHTDIVEYLRRNAVFNYKDTYIAAADEIERLRAERDALFVLTDRLTAEHDALRAERDEARREVCGLLVACHTDSDDEKPDPNLKNVHAEIRGWDCFKENTDA